MRELGRRRVQTMVLAVMVVAVTTGPAWAEASQLRRFDAALDTTLEVGLDGRGGALVRAVSPHLSFEKTTTPAGESRRSFTTRDDVVVIEHGPSGTQITARRGTVTIGASGPVEDQLKAARALLAGSSAIAMFKSLVTAAAARGTYDDFHAVSLLLDATFIAALEGDVLAFDSLVRRVLGLKGHGAPRAALVKAAWRPVPIGARADEFRDCLDEYYLYVSHSWTKLQSCIIMLEDDPWWARGAELWWCQREFEIRMATGVTQFATCAAVGL